MNCRIRRSGCGDIGQGLFDVIEQGVQGGADLPDLGARIGVTSTGTRGEMA